MGRHIAWAVGLAGLAAVAGATPASAQTRVDVGVWLPNVGARVSVGSPRVVYGRPVVYVPPPVYAPPPVYVVERGYRYAPGRRVNQLRHQRNLAKAERAYYRDVRDARRDYYDDLRDARRDYERNRRRAGR